MQFDAEEHKDTTFEALPKGNYLVMIDKAELKYTNNGKGEYLQLDLIVSGGPYNGKRLWDRFTISHTESDQAVKIGLGKLSACSRSIGLPKWNSERQLVGKTGEVTVGIDKDDPTRNDIKGWVVRDRAAQQAPASNPHKAQHYAAPAAPPANYGPPPSAQRPGAPGIHAANYGPPPSAQRPGAPGIHAVPPTTQPYQSPYPEMPRRGMSQPAPQAEPEAYHDGYEPPPYDDGVPF